MPTPARVAIMDLSLDPRRYDPVDHWSRFLDAPWEGFRPKDGFFPGLKAGFTHLLLTGSEASILEREVWVERTAEMVREAAAADLAMLGSCYGHQLLAYALAGEAHVRRCPRPEVGWIRVQALGPSRLLGDGRFFDTFTVHFDEVVDLPAPFRVLASTEACGIQAFTLEGRPIWGIQAHPEIDVPTARRLMTDFAALHPPVRPLYERALASTPRDSGVVRQAARAFLESVSEKIREK